MNFLVINGPNLNFLGIREVQTYGKHTFADLKDFIKSLEPKHNISIVQKQSNHEGDIIDILQEAYRVQYDGIVINAGAYTHYSYAIRDAIKSVQIPTVEVHLSDIYNREDFRKISVIKEVCIKTICGKGILGYEEAIVYLIDSH